MCWENWHYAALAVVLVLLVWYFTSGSSEGFCSLPQNRVPTTADFEAYYACKKRGSEHMQACPPRPGVSGSVQDWVNYTACNLGANVSKAEGVQDRLTYKYQKCDARYPVDKKTGKRDAFIQAKWKLCRSCADPVYSTNVRNQATCKHAGMSGEQ